MSNKKKYTIGIDIGGTKILACLLDKNFRILSELKVKTKPDRGSRYFMKSLMEAIHSVLRDAKVTPNLVLGIGMGCPGFIDPRTGVIAASPNIRFLKNFPLAKRIAKASGIPVTLGNDVQTGLYGEFHFGAAQGYENVIGIFLGTGIGGALILNGKPFRGTSGSAGEVGHVKLESKGPTCGCGDRGCVEAYAGRLAIASEAAVAVARGEAPHLAHLTGTDIRQIKSGALAKAIRAGDEAIEDLMRAKARRVGLLMANLVNVIDPDMIVLGGGVVEAMPSLICKEAEKTMRLKALPTSVKHVKVSPAKLGDYSIVMGAAKRAEDVFGENRKKDRRHG